MGTAHSLKTICLLLLLLVLISPPLRSVYLTFYAFCSISTYTLLYSRNDMHSEQQKVGVLFALAAFIMWGLAPIYFKQLQYIAPQEILSQRIVWSVIFLLLVVVFSRQLYKVIAIIKEPKQLALLTASACLLGTNWGVFICHDNCLDIVYACPTSEDKWAISIPSFSVAFCQRCSIGVLNNISLSASMVNQEFACNSASNCPGPQPA